MTEQSMVARVARALLARMTTWPELANVSAYWEDMSPDAQAEMLEFARAAIEAIKEHLESIDLGRRKRADAQLYAIRVLDEALK